MSTFFARPDLCLALAMLAGVAAQIGARHANVPGIVALLALGVLLGPDVANIIQPQALGAARPALIGFAVAVILFEGGLNLKLKVLRSQSVVIRRLVTLGALVTAAGGTLAARLMMGWSWTLCILFGTLVIVTGPTVITPLMRRIGVKEHIATILEAEGIFIDAVGATIAVVALEIVVEPTHGLVGIAVGGSLGRLGIGALVGLGFGLVLAIAMRRKFVPEGLGNVLAFGVAVSAYQVSSALVPESGITATIVAGLIVGNAQSKELVELASFKEQLSVLFIGTLFILLAANVRMSDVLSLGWPGVAVVGVLMFAVRPACVALSALGTDLTVRERLFMAWMAPRGIVAAAVASVFAVDLDQAGIAGGPQLKALVFLVIAVTVTLQGLSGRFIAKLLKVQREPRAGYLVLGANALARHLARALRASGEPVMVIDTNAEACDRAQADGLHVLCANGLDPEVLQEAQIEARAHGVGLTPTESINCLFARRLKDDFRGPALHVALEERDGGVTEKMARTQGYGVLFAAEQNLGAWLQRFADDRVRIENWKVARPIRADEAFAGASRGKLLPLLARRPDGLVLVDDRMLLKPGEVVEVALTLEPEDAAEQDLVRALLATPPAKASNRGTSSSPPSTPAPNAPPEVVPGAPKVPTPHSEADAG